MEKFSNVHAQRNATANFAQTVNDYELVSYYVKKNNFISERSLNCYFLLPPIKFKLGN